jgi:hypothetical protein
MQFHASSVSGSSRQDVTLLHVSRESLRVDWDVVSLAPAFPKDSRLATQIAH